MGNSASNKYFANDTKLMFVDGGNVILCKIDPYSYHYDILNTFPIQQIFFTDSMHFLHKILCFSSKTYFLFVSCYFYWTYNYDLKDTVLTIEFKDIFNDNKLLHKIIKKKMDLPANDHIYSYMKFFTSSRNEIMLMLGQKYFLLTFEQNEFKVTHIQKDNGFPVPHYDRKTMPTLFVTNNNKKIKIYQASIYNALKNSTSIGHFTTKFQLNDGRVMQFAEISDISLFSTDLGRHYIEHALCGLFAKQSYEMRYLDETKTSIEQAIVLNACERRPIYVSKTCRNLFPHELLVIPIDEKTITENKQLCYFYLLDYLKIRDLCDIITNFSFNYN